MICSTLKGLWSDAAIPQPLRSKMLRQTRSPRVAAARQPWAILHNPFGIKTPKMPTLPKKSDCLCTAGLSGHPILPESPVGTAENGPPPFDRSYGTEWVSVLSPPTAMNRWAIVKRPSGSKACGRTTSFLRELFEKASKPIFERSIGFLGPIQPGASRLINPVYQVDQPGVELGLRLKRGRQSEMNSPGFKRFERILGPRRIDVRIKWRFQKFFPVNVLAMGLNPSPSGETFRFLVCMLC